MYCPNKKPSFWYIFFSHHPYCQLNRTLRISFFGRTISLCTRCTGQYSMMFLYLAWSMKIKITEPAIVIYLLPLPATIDWLTQTLKWRESTTPIRLLTGGLFGIWLAVVVKQVIYWDPQLLLQILYQILIYIFAVMTVLLAKKGSIDDYLQPYEDFIGEYQLQRSKKTS
ncbi:DUF2085 domain-containing protein [Paenibacillus sepulcri]